MRGIRELRFDKENKVKNKKRRIAYTPSSIPSLLLYDMVINNMILLSSGSQEKCLPQ